MFYTMSLIANFVPYGNQLIDCGTQALGMNTNHIDSNNDGNAKKSKKELQRQLGVARSMNKAVKEKRLDPSYKKIADEMKVNAQNQLAENKFQNQQSFLGEIGKVAPIANVVVPGLGPIVTNATRAATIKNLGEYAQESSDTRDAALKTVKVVAPMIISVSSSLWMPFVAPWLGVAAVGVISAAIIVDSVNIVQDSQKSTL